MTKNKPRKYQDSFVQKQYDTVHASLKNAKEEIDHSALFCLEEGRTIFKSDIDKIKVYLKNRTKIAYANGFFYGWVLKHGDPLD